MSLCRGRRSGADARHLRHARAGAGRGRRSAVGSIWFKQATPNWHPRGAGSGQGLAGRIQQGLPAGRRRLGGPLAVCLRAAAASVALADWPVAPFTRETCHEASIAFRRFPARRRSPISSMDRSMELRLTLTTRGKILNAPEPLLRRPEIPSEVRAQAFAGARVAAAEFAAREQSGFRGASEPLARSAPVSDAVLLLAVEAEAAKPGTTPALLMRLTSLRRKLGITETDWTAIEADRDARGIAGLCL